MEEPIDLCTACDEMNGQYKLAIRSYNAAVSFIVMLDVPITYTFYQVGTLLSACSIGETWIASANKAGGILFHY
jgi:hypothetical protein